MCALCSLVAMCCVSLAWHACDCRMTVLWPARLLPACSWLERWLHGMMSRDNKLYPCNADACDVLTNFCLNAVQNRLVASDTKLAAILMSGCCWDSGELVG